MPIMLRTTVVPLRTNMGDLPSRPPPDGSVVSFTDSRQVIGCGEPSLRASFMQNCKYWHFCSSRSPVRVRSKSWPKSDRIVARYLLKIGGDLAKWYNAHAISAAVVARSANKRPIVSFRIWMES